MQHKKRTLIFPVQGLLFFWTAACSTATDCFAVRFWRDTNKTGCRTASLRASLSWSRAAGGSGPAPPMHRHTTSPPRDTRGLSPIPSQQPFQHKKHWHWHQRSCTSRGAAAVKLPELFFQPGDTKANPSTLSEILSNQQKTAGKMKVLRWWHTAVVDKWNTAISKVLIYCGKKTGGAGEEVGKGEKQKTYLGKKENLRETCTPH